MGFAALSVDSAITCFTPVLVAALTTFSAPCTLVRIHSNGLYSAAGTCLRAAACTTISTPRIAISNLDSSRTSPRKYRIQEFSGPGKSCAMSYCFNSSREKTISFLGLYRSRQILTNARPNDPVPPVIKIDLPSIISVSMFAIIYCRQC